jgi:hypothetical protein
VELGSGHPVDLVDLFGQVFWHRRLSSGTGLLLDLILLGGCLVTFVSSTIDAHNRTVGDVSVLNCISWDDMSTQGR